MAIEAGDLLRSGSNVTLASHTISCNAYSAGDLIVIMLGVWKDGVTTSTTTGFNGESITYTHNGYGSTNTNGPTLIVGYYIATSSYAGGSKSFDFSETTRHNSVVLIVPDGEFNAASPIGAVYGLGQSATDTPNMVITGFTANADSADASLVYFVVSDQDPVTGTASGYTNLLRHDQGRIAIEAGVKTALLSASEVIADATWTHTNDSYAAISFYVNAPPATQTLTPSLFTNNNTFYNVSLTLGPVTLEPSLFTNNNTFYGVSVNLGTVTLAPDLFVNTQTFYSPTVVVSSAELTPNLFINESVFFEPTITVTSDDYGVGGVGTRWWWTLPDYVEPEAQRIIKEVVDLAPEKEEPTQTQEIALRARLVASEIRFKSIYLDALQQILIDRQIEKQEAEIALLAQQEAERIKRDRNQKAAALIMMLV